MSIGCLEHYFTRSASVSVRVSVDVEPGRVYRRGDFERTSVLRGWRQSRQRRGAIPPSCPHVRGLPGFPRRSLPPVRTSGTRCGESRNVTLINSISTSLLGWTVVGRTGHLMDRGAVSANAGTVWSRARFLTDMPLKGWRPGGICADVPRPPSMSAVSSEADTTGERCRGTVSRLRGGAHGTS